MSVTSFKSIHTPKRSALQLPTPRDLSSDTSEDPTSPVAARSYARGEVVIDIPRLPSELAAQYEDMPGHSTVMEVLSKASPQIFTVRLGSNEIEKVTHRQLLTFECGPTALKAYQKRLACDRSSKRKRSASESSETYDLRKWQDSFQHGLVSTHTNKRRIVLDGGRGESKFQHPRSQHSTGSKVSHKKADWTIASSESDDDRPHTSHYKAQSRLSRSYRAYHDPPTSSRRSLRTQKLPQKSLRERQEDDISSASEEESVAKIATTKESFAPLPHDNPFRKVHRHQCSNCGSTGSDPWKGPLVFCQGCTDAYHEKCLGPRGSRTHLVTKIADANFVLQCRHCIGMAQQKDKLAPHQGHCSGCKKAGALSEAFRERLTCKEEQLRRENNHGIDPITPVPAHFINNPDNVLFRCRHCERSWHPDHLSSQNRSQSSQRDNMSSQAAISGDVTDSDVEQSNQIWTCTECATHILPIDAIVAWRPTGNADETKDHVLDRTPETEREYLVKWRNQSYIKVSWMPGPWVWARAASAMKISFARKAENLRPKWQAHDAIPQAFTNIDIIFDVTYRKAIRHKSEDDVLDAADQVSTVYVKYQGLGYEDAVWEEPPSVEDPKRWSHFLAAYKDYAQKLYLRIPLQDDLRQRLKRIRRHKFSNIAKTTQPTIMTGGQLMPYQIEGLNWLYWQWYRYQNAILADEMGLGKTIQVVALLTVLIQDIGCWPFLIVAPNSTIPNWKREIKKWVPSLRVVTYYGSKEAKKLSRKFELFPHLQEHSNTNTGQASAAQRQSKDIRAHIVIASYESIVDEIVGQSLKRVPWQALIIDEGQRLKNDASQTYEALSRFKIPFKILLTGTPLQNNIRELLNLLQFLDEDVDAAQLETQYQDLTQENVLDLHERLKPIFLRRTKAQVLPDLPIATQIIIPLTMSQLQKKLYKSILAESPELLKVIFDRSGKLGKKDRYNLNNVLMQLRKTLCHPFIFNPEIEERMLDPRLAHRGLVEASAKLQFLELILPKLKERGHRVLLFSQFLDNLDVMEDFLDMLGLRYQRVDGQVSSLEKQRRIDEFNAPNSSDFAFLLSTRAGGVGINLATADTVIIMDPDFNPHQDLQAVSRAHRIGQLKRVLVFQLMVKGSAEEKILAIGKNKMALDHVLIEGMNEDDETTIDYESVLKFGAAALFENENECDDERISYDSTAVDKLLDRSRNETAEAPTKGLQFNYARIWAQETSTFEETDLATTDVPINESDLWGTILQAREKAHQAELADAEKTLGRGRRGRKQINYKTNAWDGRDGEESDENKSQLESDAAYKSVPESSSSDEQEVALQAVGVNMRPSQPDQVPNSITQAPHPDACMSQWSHEAATTTQPVHMGMQFYGMQPRPGPGAPAAFPPLHSYGAQIGPPSAAMLGDTRNQMYKWQPAQIPASSSTHTGSTAYNWSQSNTMFNSPYHGNTGRTMLYQYLPQRPLMPASTLPSQTGNKICARCGDAYSTLEHTCIPRP